VTADLNDRQRNERRLQQMKHFKVMILAVFAVLLIAAAGSISAATYFDNFAGGTYTGGWNDSTGQWTVINNGQQYLYQANDAGDNSSFAASWPLATSWSYKADYSIVLGYNGGRLLNLDLAIETPATPPALPNLVLVDQMYSTSTQQSFVQVQYLTGGSWTTVLNGNWTNNGVTSPNGSMQVVRTPGSNTLTVTQTNDNGYTNTWTTAALPQAFLDGLTQAGLRVFEGVVNWKDATLVSPQLATGTLKANVNIPYYIGDWTLMNPRVDLLDSAGRTVASQNFAVTSSNGSTTFNQVPIGTYTVRGLAPHYLTEVATSTVTVGGTATANVALVAGDINGDNFVEDQDYSIMGVAWYQGGN
jgi:hypothetical protein